MHLNYLPFEGAVLNAIAGISGLEFSQQKDVEKVQPPTVPSMPRS